VRVVLLGLAISATSMQADALKREADRKSDLSAVVEAHLENVPTPAFQAGLTVGQGWVTGASAPDLQSMTAAKTQLPLNLPGNVVVQLETQVRTILNPHPPRALEPWEKLEARRGFWAAIP